ncbi:VirK/YbjX family protein [uncultured Photobacterium sp.]|uniref:VirK/YbjX family protein n=1 Tax=uncultured Photobacterium sp. TaxID=173973 RepID=UPI002631CF80|nr:VirK/YbjX family protein [uncultured Photobacterium sp.]
MSVISYISSLPKLASQVHPHSKGIQKIRKNARFCLWGVTNSKAIKTMAEVFENKDLKSVLSNNPDIIEKPLKPYLCVNWSSATRIKHLKEHYQFISQVFAQHSNAVVSGSGVTIFAFEDSKGSQYRINLYRGSRREGGLGIKLINEEDQSIYSLTFNVSGTNQRAMYIGMVQGPSQSISERQDLIRTLTRSLHGLRTKALMIEVALMLARAWDINEVKGVSNKGHVYQAIRYIGSKRKAVTFDYDDLWNEYGGENVDKYLFRLPVHPPRKDPSELKKTKRKLYTKRYQWLADTEQAINSHLAQIVS